MTSLLHFERQGQPLAPIPVFLRRLGWNFLVAVGVFAVSLVAGMIGYRTFEGLTWIEAYDSAAMILSGMGPYREASSNAGKIFAGTYARPHLYHGAY